MTDSPSARAGAGGPTTSGAESDTGSDFRRGMRLGRYELVLPIARGGMAQVWAAKLRGDRGFSKLVALKTILADLATDGAFENMFLDEARIASAVQHPNVCEVFELGDHEGTLYIAMEWVWGDSLARILGKRSGKLADPIPLEVAARVIADACAGLHAAHELVDDDGHPLDVVHRDISPHNILVTADGFGKVADFGIAKTLSGLREHATSTGELKGKLAYMSPEYASGVPIDRRADIFSMGATLYEATTGMLPFKRENEVQSLNALVNGTFERPSQLRPGFPASLEAIIVKALARDPAERFESAEAMREALETWLNQSSSSGVHARVALLVKQRIGGLLDERRQLLRGASSERTSTGSVPSLATSASDNAPATKVMTATGTGSHSASARANEGTPSITPSTEGFALQASAPAPAETSRLKLSLAAAAVLAVIAGVFGGVAAVRRQEAQPLAASAPAAAMLTPDAPGSASASSSASSLPASPASAPAGANTPEVPVMTPSDLPAASAARGPAFAPPGPRPGGGAPARRPRGGGDDEIPDNPYGGKK